MNSPTQARVEECHGWWRWLRDLILGPELTPTHTHPHAHNSFPIIPISSCFSNFSYVFQFFFRLLSYLLYRHKDEGRCLDWGLWSVGGGERSKSTNTLQSYNFAILFVCFCFLGPHPQHMDFPRLGVELELQLPAYATATVLVTPDPNHICDLNHSSRAMWDQGPNSPPHGY